MSGKDQTACPKCSFLSGDDWRQCGNDCPMEGSPHYSEQTQEAFRQLPNEVLEAHAQ